MATSEPFDMAKEPFKIVPLTQDGLEIYSRPHFKLEFIEDLQFNPNLEWLIKGLIPTRGVGAIFGDKHTFKSFIAYYTAHCLASGIYFAERRTRQTNVIYIAAEGAGGMPKRKLAYEQSGKFAPAKTFALIRRAPNLGEKPGDLLELIKAVERHDFKPGAIFLDTASATLHGADENGEGMTALVSNALALATHFECVVIVVHHVGHGEKKRMRGKSDLPGACDFQILCERKDHEATAKLTLATARDGEDGLVFTARLERVVVGQDTNGDEITTLRVADVVEVVGVIDAPIARTVANIGKPHKLLYDVIVRTINSIGEEIKPFLDGPVVKAADADTIRDRYYEALGEKTDDAKRMDYDRKLKALIDAKHLTARERDGKRMVWLS